MKEIQPLKELSVVYNGERLKVFRQEMLDDPVLGDALTSYERTLREITEVEYELKKLVHAKRSMSEELKALVIKHVDSTRNPKPEEETTQEDSNE